jgi:Fur family transcriptional regulator, peroxide stress response regulator
MVTITDILRSKGLKLSHQRIELLRHLKDRKDHPSAGQLYRSLSGEMPSLSKTTLYNTLNAFVDSGFISALAIPGEETRYEYKEKLHCHFYCTRCKSIFDLNFGCANLGDKELHGHRVDDISGCFQGICRACLNTDITSWHPPAPRPPTVSDEDREELSHERGESPKPTG